VPRHGPVRVALITGCSSGIGRAAAERFLERGWTVYATARRPETLEELKARGAHTLALDVTREDSMLAAVEQVTDAERSVGALVNNAGYGQQGPVEDTPMEEVRRQFETNVFGLVRLTQLALPGMRARGWGRVVNVSSMGGRLTLPGLGFYHGSKYAVEAISDALRFEVRPFGIGVSLVEPGPVLTRWAETAIGTIGATVEGSANRGTGQASGGAGGSADGGAESPYADWNARLVQRVASAYEGPLARLASSPEAVARVIERAASSAHPRARYVVGPVAHALTALKRLLPDAAFDALLRSQYPSP
jgi:NAD(P)-dependent dehydrogenase (short-subunit alcohol dehydrogenase family)